MARSLRKVLALLAPTALVIACSSTSGSGSSSSSSGSSGTGGTASGSSSSSSSGTGGTPSNECTDTADETAIAGDSTIGSDVTNCVLQNLSGTPATISTCIQTKDGLSVPCADCFTSYGLCGASKCLSQCTSDGGSSNPECVSCLATNCGPPFVACSGLNPSSSDGGTADGGDGGSADGG